MVPKGLRKQELLIGDPSGTARLTVWDNEVGLMKEGGQLQAEWSCSVTIRGKKFLSTSKGSSCIKKVDDVGNMKEGVNNIDDEDDVQHLKNVRIVGVQKVESYGGCLKCGARVARDEGDEEMGVCAKCHMMQCMDDCYTCWMAQVTVKLERAGF